MMSPFLILAFFLTFIFPTTICLPESETYIDPDFSTQEELLTQLSGVGLPDSPAVRGLCSPPPHPFWHLFLKNSHFYTVFDRSHCTFYNCAEFCRLNLAFAAVPRSRDELQFIMTFSAAHQVDLFLGIYLPVDSPTTVACQRDGCNKFLATSTGDPFIWQPWMIDMFDRAPGQPRCFTASHHDTKALLLPEPASCYVPRTVICQSSCPRPGIPIMPPPMTIMERQPVLPPIVMARQRRQEHLARGNVTIPRVGRPMEPLFNTSINDLADKASLLNEPNFGLPRTNDPRDVVAYDCTDPLDIRPFQAYSQRTACALAPEPVSQRNLTIALLQKADHIYTQAINCQVTETVIPFYCGVWSHGVFVHPWAKIEENVRTSTEECMRLWTEQSYTDPRGMVHKLVRNSTTRVYYHITGSTTFDNGEVSCKGGTYMYNSIPYNHMVVSASRKISLFELPVSFTSTSEVFVPRFDLHLPCTSHTEYCETDNFGSFIWTEPAASAGCRYFRTRVSSGLELEDDQGRRTFISNDGSMLRLILKDTVTACGQVVYSTNYPKLFVTTHAHDLSIFDSPLPQAEFSVYTYCNQQDGWLLGFLTTYIRKEFQALHFHTCQQELIDDNLSYDTILANQQGSLDGDTAALGGGWFVTTMGEAWFKHRCRRIIVKARSAGTCYSALPVSLSDADLSRYLTYRNMSTNSSLDFFMEPHSRRLTTRGIVVPCSPFFYGLYKGLNGNWIKISPDVSFVDPPEVLTPTAISDLTQNSVSDFDFDAGGIYHSQSITMIDTHLHAQRASQDVVTALGQDAIRSHWTSSPSTPSPFSPFMLTQVLSFSPLGWLWDRLVDWGQFASMLMGIYYIFRIGNWCVQCSSRMVANPIQPNMNIFRHVYVAARPPRRGQHDFPPPPPPLQEEIELQTLPFPSDIALPPPAMPLLSDHVGRSRARRSQSWDPLDHGLRRRTPQGQVTDATPLLEQGTYSPRLAEKARLEKPATAPPAPPDMVTKSRDSSADSVITVVPNSPVMDNSETQTKTPKPSVWDRSDKKWTRAINKNATKVVASKRPSRSEIKKKSPPPVPKRKPPMTSAWQPFQHLGFRTLQPNASALTSSSEELTKLHQVMPHLAVPPPAQQFPSLRPTSSVMNFVGSPPLAHTPVTSHLVTTLRDPATGTVSNVTISPVPSPPLLPTPPAQSPSHMTHNPIYGSSPQPSEYKQLCMQLEGLLNDVGNASGYLTTSSQRPQSELITEMRRAYRDLEKAGHTLASMDDWRQRLAQYQQRAVTLFKPPH